MHLHTVERRGWSSFSKTHSHWTWSWPIHLAWLNNQRYTYFPLLMVLQVCTSTPDILHGCCRSEHGSSCLHAKTFLTEPSPQPRAHMFKVILCLHPRPPLAMLKQPRLPGRKKPSDSRSDQSLCVCPLLLNTDPAQAFSFVIFSAASLFSSMRATLSYTYYFFSGLECSATNGLYKGWSGGKRSSLPQWFSWCWGHSGDPKGHLCRLGYKGSTDVTNHRCPKIVTSIQKDEWVAVTIVLDNKCSYFKDDRQFSLHFRCGSPSYPQERGSKAPCGHLKLEIILNFIPFSDLYIFVIKFNS